jgi:excisionase family DNA binding protein
MMTELMSVARAAKILDVSRKRVYQLIASGRLDSLRPSPRRIRITRGSLELYIQQQLEREKRELGLDIAPPRKR